MIPSTKFYTVNETGSVGPITCEADCRPNCSVTWYGPDIPVHNTNDLFLKNVERNHSGDYTCIASNLVSNSTVTVSVIVYCK